MLISYYHLILTLISNVENPFENTLGGLNRLKKTFHKFEYFKFPLSHHHYKGFTSASYISLIYKRCSNLIKDSKASILYNNNNKQKIWSFKI